MKKESVKQLIKDINYVAKRQHRYSKEARAEKSYALKDLAKAKKAGMNERAKDDKKEAAICEYFAKKREKISKLEISKAQKLKSHKK